MADDVTILDASGSRLLVSAEEITTLNGTGVAAREVQRVMLATVSGTAATDISPTSPMSLSVAQVAGTAVDVNSGNKSAGTQRVVLATDQPQLTNPFKVDGSAVTQPVALVPQASGGWSVSRLLAAGSTNATSAKGSAGQVGGWHLTNLTTSDRFLKLYNKASTPNVGTDTPLMTIPIPARSAANVEFAQGIAFGTGIAFAITTGVADNDTGALTANDVIVNLLYK